VLIPPGVSAVALRIADLARSTAFYVGLGWELSSASTAAMSVFKTAGSLLVVCIDDLLAQCGGHLLAAALAGEPTGEAVLSIHMASDDEVDAALEAAVRAGGVVIRRPLPPCWSGPAQQGTCVPVRTASPLCGPAFAQVASDRQGQS
jgi:hypothetical protein